MLIAQQKDTQQNDTYEQIPFAVKEDGRRFDRLVRVFSSCVYRCQLILGTVLVCWGLFSLQDVLNVGLPEPDYWQSLIRWTELVWFLPVPLSLVLWTGWFIFAQAVQPDPDPIAVPLLGYKHKVSYSVLWKPVNLVFRLVTRGDNIEVLKASIQAIHKAFAGYSTTIGPYLIQIVSDCPVHVDDVGMGITSVYVVPGDYVTSNRSRFKARALAYLQEQSFPSPQDWYIYLDEESQIDTVFLAGVYQFIRRSLSQQQAPGKPPRSMIGQGTIIYHGGNWFFRAADALRTADDLGRFRLQYGLGIPIFGMHGSFIVVRGIDDRKLSFDVGYHNSIAEDAAWALRAWAKGYRFGWVNGYLYEQPPQSVKDFVRQRSRWLTGIRNILGDSAIPLRYRFCLGIFTFFWYLSLLPTMVAVLVLFIPTIAFVWVQFPANISWSVFFLAYWQGIDLQVKRTAYFLADGKPNGFRLMITRFFSWFLVFGIFWYSLLEGISILYSIFRPNQGFFVIRKPKLKR